MPHHEPDAGPEPTPRGDERADAPPDDDEVMVTLGSSHDSVTDFDELLDTVPGDDEEPPR